MLISFLEKYNDCTALAHNGEQITFHALRDRVLQLAAYLNHLNIKAGDRIGIYGEVSIDYICVLYAIISSGAVVVPLNSRLPAAEIQKRADSINCQLIITTKSWGKKIKRAHRMDQLFIKTKLPGDTVKNTDIDQNASILFTSGSSAIPKAVLHTFGSHYYNALGSNENLPLNPGEQWLLSLPLYHVSGIAICMRALISGATVVIPDKTVPFGETIKRNGVTHLSLVPTQLFRLLGSGDMSWSKSLKALLLGGGPIPVSLIHKALQFNLPLYTSYGSTEMASQITTTKPHACDEELLTAGYPLKYREIKVESKGEIFCRGATLAKGYVEQNGIQPIVDHSGWFRTGDRGTIDEKGRLRILGRLDRMFISGGENIYPEEIECVLCTFDGVEEAVVVPVSDYEFGERPVAFVRWGKKMKPNYEALQVFTRASLPGYMFPVKWYDWPLLMENGKTQISTLQAITKKNISSVSFHNRDNKFDQTR
jgi:O-succinylbenzoic acid--CoA ligase